MRGTSWRTRSVRALSGSCLRHLKPVSVAFRFLLLCRVAALLVLIVIFIRPAWLMFSSTIESLLLFFSRSLLFLSLSLSLFLFPLSLSHSLSQASCSGVDSFLTALRRPKRATMVVACEEHEHEHVSCTARRRRERRHFDFLGFQTQVTWLRADKGTSPVLERKQPKKREDLPPSDHSGLAF